MSAPKPNRILAGEFVYIERRGTTGLYSATWWRNGKHNRRALGTRNRDEAIRRARRLEADVVLGTEKPANAPPTIKSSIDKFIAHKESESRRKKTTIRYRGILDVFRAAMEERKRSQVDQIETEDIIAFRKNRRTRTNGVPEPKTMHNELVCIKGFLRWCCERDYIERNPATPIRPKKPSPPKRGGPDSKQLAKILESARDYRRPHLAVLIYTGMRSAELSNLRGEDIDLTGNWIHVVSRPGAETKNGQSRTIPMHPHLRLILEQIPRHKGKPFFCSTPSKKYPSGDHCLSGKHLNVEFSRLLPKIGMSAGRKEGFTIHSIRHSFETICVNANIPQRVIDTWLGHTGDRSMGFNYYKLSDSDSQAFMLKVPFVAPSFLDSTDKGTAS